jgi:hypothetical protein
MKTNKKIVGHKHPIIGPQCVTSIADLEFITPPQNQGQIVEISYACDEDGFYRRTIDHSLQTRIIEFASWQSWSNDPLPDPDLGDWIVLGRMRVM